MFALDPLLLSGLGTYKLLFISASTVLVEQAELHFENTECAPSYENVTTKEEVLTKVSNYGVLEARLR